MLRMRQREKLYPKPLASPFRGAARSQLRRKRMIFIDYFLFAA